jgi:hypothetical protein
LTIRTWRWGGVLAVDWAVGSVVVGSVVVGSVVVGSVLVGRSKLAIRNAHIYRPERLLNILGNGLIDLNLLEFTTCTDGNF